MPAGASAGSRFSARNTCAVVPVGSLVSCPNSISITGMSSAATILPTAFLVGEDTGQVGDALGVVDGLVIEGGVAVVAPYPASARPATSTPPGSPGCRGARARTAGRCRRTATDRARSDPSPTRDRPTSSGV